jgi:hypothetical protein
LKTQSKRRSKRKRGRKANPFADTPPALVGALKLDDACRYIGGIHVATTRRLVKRGLVKPNRMLRHLLFPIKELDRALREGIE